MWQQNSIVLMLVVSLFGYVWEVSGASKSDNTQSPITYELLVDKKISSQANSISCRLRIINTTNELQFVSRCGKENILLNIEGLDKLQYSMSFVEKGFEFLYKRDIPLRPKCAFEIELAKIMFKKNKEGDVAIPTGSYILTASWKLPDLPEINTAKFEVVNKDEYPLDIILEPLSKIYYLGDPIMVSVQLQNNGSFPITLMNYFDPEKDFFRFEKKSMAFDKGKKEITHLPSCISPNAIDGWITLLPGESLSVAIDASDEFATIGQHRTKVTFYRSRIALHPPNAKSFHTKQHTWESNEIDIIIIPVCSQGRTNKG